MTSWLQLAGALVNVGGAASQQFEFLFELANSFVFETNLFLQAANLLQLTEVRFAQLQRKTGTILAPKFGWFYLVLYVSVPLRRWWALVSPRQFRSEGLSRTSQSEAVAVTKPS